MRSPDFWKSHYVVETDPAEIEHAMSTARFSSGTDTYELVCFVESRAVPNILVSQGSGGHAYVFAEFGYQLHRAGYNVFIMPKHGGRTVEQLLARHQDALRYISTTFNDTIGVYSEGLGGYVSFYLALARAPFRSLVCQNSPAIMTETGYREALLTDGGPWAKSVRRRRLMMPIITRIARIVPGMRVPVSSYLSWRDLIDTRPENGQVEHRLVVDGYLRDPDFDRWYPLSAVMSLMTTPPPSALDELRTPTMFVVASDGPTPAYIVDLYRRLPAVPKRLEQVNGSVYWMLSHPRAAAGLVSDWFASSL